MVKISSQKPYLDLDVSGMWEGREFVHAHGRGTISTLIVGCCFFMVLVLLTIHSRCRNHHRRSVNTERNMFFENW